MTDVPEQPKDEISLMVDGWLAEKAKETVEQRTHVTERVLLEALRVRYPENSYAYFPHLREHTGGGPTRIGDAVVFGLWPSRGMQVEGFEVKISRSDWLRELKDPSKAESIFKYCDLWWLVAGDDKIVM